MIVEIFNRIFLKIKIYLHKFVNRSLYKKGVELHGVPKIIYREKIELQEHVKINQNVFMHGAGGIEIKKNTTLSYGTTILSTGYETQQWMSSTERTHTEEKIVIGKNVWVGANVTILQGVQIADNVIIGAGSVVNKSLLVPGHLYAGVPAKKIKKL